MDIFNALQDLGEDVRSAKLIKGKVTSIHRRLWPAFLGVAVAGESWQTAKLCADAAAVLEQVLSGDWRRTRPRRGLPVVVRASAEENP